MAHGLIETFTDVKGTENEETKSFGKDFTEEVEFGNYMKLKWKRPHQGPVTLEYSPQKLPPTSWVPVQILSGKCHSVLLCMNSPAVWVS